MRLSFVLYFSSTNNFFTIYFYIFNAVKIKLRSQFKPNLIYAHFRTEFVFFTDFSKNSADFRTILPFCGNVGKFYGNVRKYHYNSFREFRRIPQKRFPYSSAEFYGNFLSGLKLDDI